jgi:hydrogenase maturation protease
MTSVLIIGIGNPLRGDDGLGWRAIEELGRRLPPAAAELLTVQQLTLDLVEPVRDADQVIFIDAAAPGPPGTLSCETVEPGTPQSLISHQFDPPTLLACVQSLYGRCPRAMVLSITAATFDYGEQLSPVVAAALPQLIDRVLASLASPSE